jgi:hypothetical protein
MASANDSIAQALRSTTQALDTINQTRAGSCKIPKFLAFDVALWTQQCEAAFLLAGITDEAKKFAHVTASLEPEVTRRVAKVIASPPSSDQFNALCAALRQAYDKTVAQKWAAIHELAIGDMRPSELYLTIERMWPDAGAETSEILWHLFCLKLPSAVALHLHPDVRTRAELVVLADKLQSEHQQRVSASVAVNAVAPSSASKQKKTFPSRAGTATTPCFFHKKFGTAARQCATPCSQAKPPGRINTVTKTIKALRGTANGHAEYVSTRQAVYLGTRVDGARLIADTGASCSILPARQHERRRRPNLELFRAANGSAISCYGRRKITFDLGLGRMFTHNFYTCDVDEPLLGYDFFLSNRLVVDPVYNRLLDVDTLRFAPGCEPAKISQVTPSAELLGKFSFLWSQYPGLVDPSIQRFRSKPKHDVKHHIVLKPDARPAHGKPRRLTGDKLEAAREEINTMLDLGIIQPSESAWASPLHVVQKPGGGYRPCGDFRQLNAMTEPDRYPLPHVLDFANSLANCTIFSKVDLVRAYHQIPMDEASIPLTAITTCFGMYEFKRMPFGLCNAGQSFQRFVDNVTRGL